MADDKGRIARCAGAEEERDALARALFEQAWHVPQDTYITDGFPLLLYKLSRIERATEAEPDAPGAA